jgi:tetratricopeptide (TPR) repeat protein
MNIVRSNQDISSTSSEGIFRRAGATLRRYRTEDAIELYKEASLKKPTDARFVNDLGVAQLSLGDNAEARKSFIRAIGLSASFPHPYYNLAILSKDNAEEADKYLNQGIKVDPDPTAAHLYVGKLYDQIFYNKKKAANHYQAYLDMGGNNPEVSSWLKDAR